jgi:monovalent cation:H+ antiporter, CPA1 family
VAASERELRDFYNQRDRQDSQTVEMVRRQVLLAEKSALVEAARKRLLSEEVIKSRLKAIDGELLGLDEE